MPITPELLDEPLKDYKSPDDMFGDDGLLQQLTKAVVERALQGEMTHHLGYEKHAPEGKHSGNSRNGKSSKRIKSKRGQIEIDVPRDRNSAFEPHLNPHESHTFSSMMAASAWRNRPISASSSEKTAPTPSNSPELPIASSR